MCCYQFEFLMERAARERDCACFATGIARFCCGGCICLTCVVGSPELLNDSFVAEPTVLFEIVVLMVNIMLTEGQSVASWVHVPLTHVEKVNGSSDDSL